MSKPRMKMSDACRHAQHRNCQSDECFCVCHPENYTATADFEHGYAKGASDCRGSVDKMDALMDALRFVAANSGDPVMENVALAAIAKAEGR